MIEFPGLAEAADALYSADPADFVARRDALAKEARARKDRALAAAIGRLRRPTVGAWYVNLAVRAGLTSLRELLRLGRELRAAQADLDFARVVALGPRRADVERRVLADLRAHLAALGLTASPAALEEVRSTLRAALTDADAAAAVESGRLARPLEYGAGMPLTTGSLPDEAPMPEESAPEPVSAPPDDDLAELERQAAAAEAALAASRARLEAAQAQRERLRARRALAAAEERLAAATFATASARAEHDRLATAHGAAAVRLEAAEAEQAAATAAVSALRRAAERP